MDQQKSYQTAFETFNISYTPQQPKHKPRNHKCHARGCDTPTWENKLMCRHHWTMVPPELQTKVWKNYRQGQEKDKHPSREWTIATLEAINHVARKEGRGVITLVP